MKCSLLFGFLCIVSVTLYSQDITVMINEAERLERSPNEYAALTKLKEVLLVQPTNVHALAKCSELCSRIGSRQPTAAARDAWFKPALEYAHKAIAVNPLNDEANVSMAMILGKSSLTKSGKEKLKNARLIKKGLEIALHTNPNNYLAWHILGRWNYEISDVSGLQRAGASLFYGGVPDGSLKNAIMYLEKTRSLMPGFILNYLSLANAYHRDGQTKKAINILNMINALPINTEDDPQHKKVALKLINEWN